MKQIAWQRRFWWLVIVVAVLTSGCVGPARSEADYRADISNTAKIAAGAVASAALTVQAVAAEKSTSPYMGRRLTEDEQMLQSTITAFGSVQPPTRAMDDLRTQLVTVLEEASGAVGDLRIAAFRDDRHRVVELGRKLPELVERIRAYEDIEKP